MRFTTLKRLALAGIERLAPSQVKNQAARRKINECNEPEAGRKGVSSVIENANRVVANKPAELPDGIQQAEGCGRCCLT